MQSRQVQQRLILKFYDGQPPFCEVALTSAHTCAVAEEPAFVTAVPVAHEHMRAVTSSPARLRPAPVAEVTHGLDARPRQ